MASVSIEKGSSKKTSATKPNTPPFTPTQQYSPQSPASTPLASTGTPSKKRKSDQSQSSNGFKKQTVKMENVPPLSFDEKRRICTLMTELTNDQLLDALDILNYNSKGGATEAETLDIDLNEIDDTTLRQLERFINQCLDQNKKWNIYKLEKDIYI